jgi:hypothetical protein
MLEPEDFMVIQALVQRGAYLCDIAQQLGVHPRTVRRALQRGGPPRPRGGRRGSRLDPYRPVVDQLLADGVWNAVVIWRELHTKGYTGGVSILRDYIQPKRALRPSRATVRFETEPGRQLQTDWAVQRTQVAGREVDVHFAVNTLGHSRRFHFWCTDTEDAEHTYEGLVRAFEWFGGVPGELDGLPGMRGRVLNVSSKQGKSSHHEVVATSEGELDGCDELRGRYSRRLPDDFLQELIQVDEVLNQSDGVPKSTPRRPVVLLVELADTLKFDLFVHVGCQWRHETPRCRSMPSRNPFSHRRSYHRDAVESDNRRRGSQGLCAAPQFVPESLPEEHSAHGCPLEELHTEPRRQRPQHYITGHTRTGRPA